MRNTLFFVVTFACNLYGGEFCRDIIELTYEALRPRGTCTLTPPPPSALSLCCAKQPRTLRITNAPEMTRVAGLWSLCFHASLPFWSLPLCGFLPPQWYCVVCTAVPVACAYTDVLEHIPEEITCTLPACCAQRKPNKAPVMNI